MLIHRLALRLGMTMDELQHSMDEEEMHQWMVFDAIEPIGDVRQDTLAGFICAAQHGGKPADFRPQWDDWIEDAEVLTDPATSVSPERKAEIDEERQLIAFKAEIQKLIRKEENERLPRATA